MVKRIDDKECAKCLMQKNFVKQHCQGGKVHSLLPGFTETGTGGALMG